MNIKKEDNVVVISGKHKGAKGKVMAVLPKENKVIIGGVNIISRHKKPKGQKDPGGIVKQEAALHASNVMLVCKKCAKATRVSHKKLESGEKVRVCKKCGDTFDNK
jgi:large subunit ribosomal protein L24